MCILPPLKFAPPADGISLLRDGNAGSSLRAPSVVCSTPTQKLYFAAGIFHSQSLRITAPLLRFSLLGSNCESITAAAISPTWRSKVCRYHWWTNPIRKHHRLSKSLSEQTNHAGNRDQHSEAAWSFWLQKTKVNSKAGQARSIQSFSFQRNICFILKNPSILNTFL